METQSPVAIPARRDLEDDEFDVMPHVMLVWRRRVVVIVVTLSCIVLAVLVSLLVPRVYSATARVYLGEPGSSGHVKRFGRILLLARDASIASHVLEDASLDLVSKGLTLQALSSAITIGENVPPNAVMVSVRLRNADLASLTARALALRIVEVYRVRLTTAIETVETKRRIAREFKLTKQLRQRRDAQELVKSHREKLSAVLAESAEWRARLAAAKGDAGASALARVALAGLEARRSYLLGAIAEGDNAEALTSLDEDQLMEQRLDADVAFAQESVNEMGMVSADASRADSTETPPAVIESSAPEGRDVSPGMIGIVLWALAFGLVASVLGVIVRDRWTRTTAQA